MRAIVANRQHFKRSLAQYGPSTVSDIGFLDLWDRVLLRDKDVLSYEIRNGGILPGESDSPAEVYRAYLNHLEMFLILASNNPEIQLTPSHIYFSPYRQVQQEDLRANLFEESFNNRLLGYLRAVSQLQTSLVKIATLRLAEKRRHYESMARNQGYMSTWQGDAQVKLLDEYMSQLGYEWGLTQLNAPKSIYEIELVENGRQFSIGQASSGEKELINFLLGVVALGVRGGLIIIDEPDLHLHPKWQHLLTELLTDVGLKTGNQVILATHSPAFITPQTIDKVRRVYKDDNGASKVQTVADNGLDDTRALLHIVTTHNNEKMFFADRVVL